MPNTPKPLALVYIRVSTAEQSENGASLEAQESTLILEATRRGFDVEVVTEAGRSGSSISGRPALLEALQRLREGRAQALVAQRLDRVSRSVADFAQLLDVSAREGWRLVITEADVDTSTPSGRFLMNVLASAAQFERDLVSARTKDALAERRRQGVRLGRPRSLDGAVLDRMRAERAAGDTYSAIARRLQEDCVPTARGGLRWYPATVRKALMADAGGCG